MADMEFPDFILALLRVSNIQTNLTDQSDIN